jgi:glutamate N-acetyltransferase/amino-acid N-acetyltransferase
MPFAAALEDVCRQLAHLVVRDGEGAQKFIAISVSGAFRTKARAKSACHRQLALVKTAIAGEDANWGRVVMAVGKAGEPADRDRLSIGFGGTWAAREGQPLADYDEAPVAAHLKGQDITIEVDLGLGDRPRHGLDLRSDPRLHLDQRGLPLLTRALTRRGAGRDARGR